MDLKSMQYFPEMFVLKRQAALQIAPWGLPALLKQLCITEILSV